MREPRIEVNPQTYLPTRPNHQTITVNASRIASTIAMAGDHDNDALPQPFDAKRLAPAKKRQRSTSPNGSGNASASGEAPRKLKRPGQRARITDAEREQIRQRALERERAAQKQAEAEELRQRANINDVVKAHYNAVPERGREWRKTDSRIKGLRSFNNWVKSCIIQKFSPDEDHAPGAMERGISSGNKLLVLDIGCGKGGDLFKWQQAPQTVDLYVGLDPAEVSIDQARERYRSMANRGGGGGRGGRGGRASLIPASTSRTATPRRSATSTSCGRSGSQSPPSAAAVGSTWSV